MAVVSPVITSSSRTPDDAGGVAGMLDSLLADAVLLLHLGFIVFVVGGALLVWRIPRLAWMHLPAVLWAGMIEIGGQVCPLTPLEIRLRRSAGEAGYEGGFVEHYLLPLIYPHDLSRDLQIALGVGVLVFNGLAYFLLIYRMKRHGR
jgi:hypothetical protein